MRHVLQNPLLRRRILGPLQTRLHIAPLDPVHLYARRSCMTSSTHFASGCKCIPVQPCLSEILRSSCGRYLHENSRSPILHIATQTVHINTQTDHIDTRTVLPNIPDAICHGRENPPVSLFSLDLEMPVSSRYRRGFATLTSLRGAPGGGLSLIHI